MKGLRVWIGPAAAVLAFVALFVVWHYVSKQPAKPSTPNASKQVIDVKSDDVQQVAIAAGGKELVLVRVDKPPAPGSNATTPTTSWHIGSPTGTETKPFAVDDLLFGLDPLTADRTVTVSPKDAGLEPPAKTLTLTEKGGQKVALQFGGTAPVGGIYARVQGQAQIYLIAGTLPNQLNPDPSSWLPAPAPSQSKTPGGSSPAPAGSSPAP